VESSVVFDDTLIHQSVVVTLNGVFHDGSEGDGLIGALAVMLDFGYQFHRGLTEADTELLGSIGLNLCGFLGKGVGGANCFEFLPAQH
jgi:hypothetical protein